MFLAPCVGVLAVDIVSVVVIGFVPVDVFVVVALLTVLLLLLLLSDVVR